MAKTNKLPPKNAAAKTSASKPSAAKTTVAKTVSTKSVPNKVVAKATKASPVSKSVASKTAASPVKSSAKPQPKASTPAKAAGKAPTKVNPVGAKPAPLMKAATVKPVPAKPEPDKAAAVQKAPVVAVAAVARQPVAAVPPPQRAMPAAGTKLAAERISAPVPPARPVPPVAQAVADPNAPKKAITTRHGFKTNELIVYPAHGVGRIIGIEEQEIAGISLELFVIEFEKDKMTLRVPTSKLVSVGMRKLAEDGVLKRAMETLRGKARIKRTMWSRRAQEYEAKINSGDLVSIAEVVRDLYRSEAQPEQSYSERQLYEAALDRMSRELAAVDKSDERSAMQRITEILSKSAKGRRAVEEEAQAAAAGEGDVKAA